MDTDNKELSLEETEAVNGGFSLDSIFNNLKKVTKVIVKGIDIIIKIF